MPKTTAAPKNDPKYWPSKYAGIICIRFSFPDTARATVTAGFRWPPLTPCGVFMYSDIT